MFDPTDEYLSRPRDTRRGPPASVSMADVEKAVEELEKQNRRISVDAVYALIGRGRGTIAKLLQPIRARRENQITPIDPEISPLLVDGINSVVDAVRNLQTLLNGDAKRQIELAQEISNEKLAEAALQIAERDRLLEVARERFSSVEAASNDLSRKLEKEQLEHGLIIRQLNDSHAMTASLTQEVVDLKIRIADKESHINEQATFLHRQQEAIYAAKLELQTLDETRKNELIALRKELTELYTGELTVAKLKHEDLATRLSETRAELQSIRDQLLQQTEQGARLVGELREARHRIEGLTIELALSHRSTDDARLRADDNLEALIRTRAELDHEKECRLTLETELRVLRALHVELMRTAQSERIGPSTNEGDPPLPHDMK